MPVHTPAANVRDLADIFGGWFDPQVKARNAAKKQGDALEMQNRAISAAAMQKHLQENPDDYSGAILAARQAVANIAQTKTQTGALAQDTQFKSEDQRRAQKVETKSGSGFGANQLPTMLSNDLGNRREDWNEKNLSTNNLLTMMATGAISKEDMPRYMAAIVSQDPRAAASEMMQRKVMAMNQVTAENNGIALRDNLKKITDPATKQAMIDQAAKRYADQTGGNLFQNINASSNLGLLKELNKHDPRFLVPEAPKGPDGKPLPTPPEGKPTAPGQPSGASGFLDKMKGFFQGQDFVPFPARGAIEPIKKGATAASEWINRNTIGGGSPPAKAVKKGVPTVPDKATNNDTPLPTQMKDEPELKGTAGEPSRMSDLIAEAKLGMEGQSETDIDSMARALQTEGVNPAELADAGPTPNPTPLFANNDNRVVNPSGGGRVGPTPVEAAQIASILGLGQPSAIAQTTNAPMTVPTDSKPAGPAMGGPDLKPLPPMNDDMTKNAIAAQGVQAQTLGPMLAQIIGQLNLGGKRRTV